MNVIEQTGFCEKCTGCTACVNKCTHNAIAMEADCDGFLMPKVKINMCTDCGLCVKICPIKQPVMKKNFEKEAFSFISDDDIRQKSSSGGAFYYLAKQVLDKDGVVYGAAFDSENKIVRHMSTDEVSLEKIMRSKYVQSALKSIFSEIKQKLEKGHFVLFSGTPCQVNGLNAYLSKMYDNLLTVDFVCHGVPSPRILSDLIIRTEKANSKLIKEVTFREKDLGWKKQILKFHFLDGSYKTEISKDYYYYYLFLNNVILRKSCYSCECVKNHTADITLMDYWSTECIDDKGVSAVVINSTRGKNAFKKLEEFDGCSPLPLNKISYISLPHEVLNIYKDGMKNRKKFFAYYHKNGIEKAINNWFPKYKIRNDLTLSIKTKAYKIINKLKNL